MPEQNLSGVSFAVHTPLTLRRGLGWVKPVLLVPHIFFLLVLWPLQLVSLVIAGLWVLFTGRHPKPLYEFSTWVLRWFTNVIAYASSLTDQYPPFTGRQTDYPVEFAVRRPDRLSQPGAFLKIVGLFFFPQLWLLMQAVLAGMWVVGAISGLFLGRYPRRARLISTVTLYAFLHLYCLLAHMHDDWKLWKVTWRRKQFLAEPQARYSTFDAAPDPEPGGSNGYVEAPFEIRRPATLPTFADVGGMADVKQRIRETIGLLFAYPDLATKYGVTWNGILFHGPTGSGKTHMAEATAGEFGLNFMSVGAGELLSAYRGRSAQRVVEAFETASRNLPCMLLFDEFDSIALRRSATPQSEERATVTQLLRSLERYRILPELLVVAATNDPNRLDEAVVRPGRFDCKIRVDLPDRTTRAQILQTLLSGKPLDSPDVEEIAARTEGLSAAALRAIVDGAALDAMRAESEGRSAAITRATLLDALAHRSGRDRPLAPEWRWDQLILSDSTKSQLIQLQRFIEEPELARRYGIAPPSGMLLYGPPGTGKTTIAKVLAAQASASFYPITPSDLMSKWVGETEENISQLFQRARENRPSIVFLDEIDALFPRRGVIGSFDDRWTDHLLQEIDGMRSLPGVFVVGATNRADLLDPALLRGGRLSRQIEIPLPDVHAREELFRLTCRPMPIENVDLVSLAHRSEGFSGADIKALAQDAAVRAAIRTSNNGHHEVFVGELDFEHSLEDFAKERLVR